MKRLYVVWQDEDTRRWHPVGMLTRADSNFQFVYTEGAKLASGFIPFGRMTDLSKVYQSEELFPLFANRILSRSRPEYDSFARWISADFDPDNPMLLLARTGGSRFTDSLMIYEKPEPNERNEFDLVFLCHGIRYFSREAIARIDTLAEGENLLPMFDPLNLRTPVR